MNESPFASDEPPAWFQSMVMPENMVDDIRIVQRDRAQTAQGYKFQTAAEMSAMPVKKDWLIKRVFARGESSAWVAP